MNNKDENELLSKADLKALKLIHKIKKKIIESDGLDQRTRLIQRNHDLVQNIQNCKDLKSLYKYAIQHDYAYKKFQEIQLSKFNVKIKDDILVYVNQDYYSVGKVLRIIGVKNFSSWVPILKVKWYFQKKELPFKEEEIDFVSDKELFLSEQIDCIQPDTIMGLASVIGENEYQYLSASDHNVYFTRATFINQRFDPPIKQWPKLCICRKPSNPDLKYIQCEKCEEWFHVDCIWKKLENLNENEQFYCKQCERQKN